MNSRLAQMLEIVHKEFKTAFVNMVKDLKQGEQMGSLNRERETIKKWKFQKCKIKYTKRKNSLDGFNTSLDTGKNT